MVIIQEDDYLAHYGILRRSGRYPWGSGVENENQRNKAFLDYVDDLKNKGLSEKEIAVGLDASITELRAAKSIAKNEQKQSQIIIAHRLKNDAGMSNVAIGREMGVNESVVRSLLAPGAKDKADNLMATANMLKAEVDKKKWLDVGSGVETGLNVSETKLKTAVIMLQEQGYEVWNVPVPQLGTGKNTQTRVLSLPGTTQRQAWENRDNIQQIQMHSQDGGRTFLGIHPPLSVDLKRVAINYAEDGGGDADGVIYVRHGVPDVSLGKSQYAQVRILVDDTHYIKGMAMYKDDLPKGVDLLFNTNKENTGNKKDALKPITDDPDNPFGAVIKAGGQQVVKDADGKEHLTSAMNILSEEGDWSKWSKSLSSQILSKQSPILAKSQLDMTYERRQNEYKEISKLTNSTVRKRLLSEFADGTDAYSVHLKAAHLPRQASHIILPITSMKPHEVYAPNYNDGEKVVIIRHPHGGTFEIPELTVNNKQREAKRLLGSARDAIGIHPSVAQRLSGADFDGDTVLVIPNNAGKITHTKALTELMDFDPVAAYPGYEGMKVITNKQTEMGKVSNLITDMTIKGADHSEIARAVKHSMVVIDSEKGLNYKQSYADHGIAALKDKYQTKLDGSQGASTIISRAKSPVYIPQIKPRTAAKGGPVDKVTGRKEFEETGAINRRTGQPRTTKMKALQVATDARALMSNEGVGTPIERLYADHSNRLKALANQARLASINTPPSKYSSTAKQAYPEEVASLNAKLALALRNRPLERQAQILANSVVKAKHVDNPDMGKELRKKIQYQALAEMRNRTKVSKTRIEITPSEWDAIQAGAISDSKLNSILDKANMDTVKKLATPHTQQLMTSTMKTRARRMLNDGYTRAQVAAQLGVSVSTLDVADVEPEE